ncbi:MAG TPA: tail fiber domain-containing protein [Longimicrobium sp.]|nr:tail fiber domain-containing protein [Longimicrobium sp.]
MRHFARAAFAAALAATFFAAPAAAQSDILLRLRSGSPLGDRFRIDSAGGLVALGSLGIGIIPSSGNPSGGVRMMWYPFKGSFRAGSPGGAAATSWDDANLGFYNWAGGYETVATGIYSFAMGDGSTTPGQAAFAIGEDNNATGSRSVAMGWDNRAMSVTSTAIGREAHAGTSFRASTNTQGGALAVGHKVTADADWSVAMGWRASTAGFVGSFVYGGSLAGASAATDSIRSTSAGQATWRVPGGFRIFTNTAATVGVQVNAGGSSWNVISDRNRKENFLTVDGEDLLGRLRSVPVTTWQYRDEADRTVRHIGPMAQDWARAFGFSRDDRTINMSDFDGVNLAAVQALERRTAEQKTQIETLNGEVAALRAANAALEARLQRLEARAAGTPAP